MKSNQGWQVSTISCLSHGLNRPGRKFSVRVFTERYQMQQYNRPTRSLFTEDIQNGHHLLSIQLGLM